MNKENKIRKELEKVLLTYEKPSIYFEKLRKDNKLKILYPEINDLIGVIQSPIHHPEGDVFNHTMMVVDDLLNPYHLLTNRIIDMDFPPLVREELEDSKDKNISVKKKISRNEKCPCGSGLKYKFCCGKNK